MGEWVKCSERMPEPGAIVLVWEPDYGFPVPAFWNSLVPCCWMDAISREDIEDVTHWMPFPCPPA